MIRMSCLPSGCLSFLSRSKRDELPGTNPSASARPLLKRGNTLRGNFVSKFETPIEDTYELNCQKPLGTGSFGVVVVGRHRDTARMFAIKIVDKACHLTRIEREIKLMSDVDHANIARLFCIYDAMDTVCFVMDLCTGGHLGDLLSYGGKSYLEESRAKILITQLVSAVAHLHSRGICHRDIKLQNILMEHRDYVTAQIKLIDFGFATRFVGLSPLKTRCGTPYTTAPEVYRECYDERCDLWSVGVVTYILLSGYRPFVAVDLPGDLRNAGKAAMVTSILMGRYHFDHAPFKKVSPQGISFIQNMLHPDYTKRWHAVGALNSPWLNGPINSTPLELKVSGKDTALSIAVSNMRKKAHVSSLGNTSMVAVAFSKSQTEAVHLRSLFQSFDKENVGYLTKETFRKAMLSISPDLSCNEIDRLFEAIDVDNDKQVSFTEFLAATMDPREVKLDDLSKAFRLLDSNNKGYLTDEDFCRVLAIPDSGVRRMKLLRKRKSEKGLAMNTSSSDLNKGREKSGNGSEELSKSYVTGMGDDEILGPGGQDEDHDIHALMEKIHEMIASADSDKDGKISYSEFLIAMGNADRVDVDDRLVMKDLVELEESENSSSSMALPSISGSDIRSSVPEEPRPESGGSRSRFIPPALLKKGRSMPFIDQQDQVPLSPIHESPQRKSQSPMRRIFFGEADDPKPSPLAKSAVYIDHNLNNVVDDLSSEDLLYHNSVVKKPPIVPQQSMSAARPPLQSNFFSAALVDAKGPDNVYAFEEAAPPLSKAKRWASEGNILKRLSACGLTDDFLDEDFHAPNGKVVNGSPDKVRSQMKIDYIVEAVKEVSVVAALEIQTPRLALSRQNSKALESLVS